MTHPELGPPPPLPENGLRVVALGGLGEIGRNMTVFEYDGRLLVVLEQQHAVRVWDVARLNALLAEHKLGW